MVTEYEYLILITSAEYSKSLLLIFRILLQDPILHRMRTWLHSLVVWSLIHFWTDQRQNWCSPSIASLPQQALKLNNFTATTCIFKSIQTKQYIFQFWLPDFFFLHSFTSLSSSTRFSSKSSSDNWAMFTSSRAEWTAATELFSLDRKSLNGTSSSFWSKTIFF